MSPFAPSLSEPNEFEPIEIVKQDESVSDLSITGWLLPHQNDCDKDQKDQVKHSTKGQGFYIYRENRLIQAGGWADIQGWSTIEPHYSLLRVEFEFDYELDEAFEIDVKKSKIIIDPGLGDVVKQLIAPLRREADNRYRKKKKASAASSTVSHRASNVAVSAARGTAAATVVSADQKNQSVEVQNNQGRITVRLPVKQRASSRDIHIRAVDTIYDGQLWEARVEVDADGRSEHVVLLNKHHDFYSKIYQSASDTSVSGIDLLIWSMANAELNNVTDELIPVFEDLRDEISRNLRKLLADFEIPDLDLEDDPQEESDD